MTIIVPLVTPTYVRTMAAYNTEMNRSMLTMHFCNHQTHHRGQTHALITAAGENSGDTDMFLLPAVLAAAGAV